MIDHYNSGFSRIQNYSIQSFEASNVASGCHFESSFLLAQSIVASVPLVVEPMSSSKNSDDERKEDERKHRRVQNKMAGKAFGDGLLTGARRKGYRKWWISVTLQRI